MCCPAMRLERSVLSMSLKHNILSMSVIQNILSHIIRILYCLTSDQKCSEMCEPNTLVF